MRKLLGRNRGVNSPLQRLPTELINWMKDRPESDDKDICNMSKTIAKYDMGSSVPPSPSTPDDDEEAFTDRFGFIHKNGDQTGMGDTEDRQYFEEARRNTKWLKILNNFKNYKNTRKLSDRVFKGIPDSIRGYAWCVMLDVPEKMQKDSGLYKRLKAQIGEYGEPSVIDQIDVDIERTFRNHVHFKDLGGFKQRELFFILATYSIYNTELGYCQGMHEMAATFLLYMKEEEAFWCFSNFMSGPRITMHGFLIESFPKLIRYQIHHDSVVSILLPDLFKFMETNELSNFYNINWFMMAFMRFPFSLCIRIWDVFLLRGDEVLVGMAFTLMKFFQEEVMSMSEENAFGFFQKCQDHPYIITENDDILLEQLKENLEKLREYGLNLPPYPTDNSENFKLSLKCLGIEDVTSRASGDQVRSQKVDQKSFGPISDLKSTIDLKNRKKNKSNERLSEASKTRGRFWGKK